MSAIDPTVKNLLMQSYMFETSGTAWDVVEGLAYKITYFLEIVSQIAFLLGVLGQRSDGPGFIIACIAEPVLGLVITPHLWSKGKKFL